MWIFQDIISAVLLIIMAIVFVIGIFGVAFDIQQIRESVALWGLTWFEILAIIFALAFWVVVIRLLRRIHQFEKTRPSISIIPPFGKTREAVIAVLNDGCPAFFSANARLVGASKPPDYEDSYPETYPFTMVWEETASDTIEIVKRSQRRIRLVSYMVGKNDKGEETHWLRFWKYTAQGAVPIDVRHWRPGIESPEEIGILVRVDTKPELRERNLYRFKITPHLNLGVSVEMSDVPL